MNSIGCDLKIKVNGITINYDDLGTGKVPIVFIHGFPFNKSTWQPQLDFLKKTNRVIAYDIRGFGHSTTDGSEVSMDIFANDLITFLDALEIKKVIACGLSMGGYILLNALERFPERFEAIVLSDTQCISDSIEAKEKRFKTIHQIEEGDQLTFSQDFVAAIFCKKTLLTKDELVQEIKNLVLSTSPKTLRKTLKAIALRSEMDSILEKIAVPTLIICGKEDNVTPLEQSEFLYEHIYDSSLCVIDEAGHLSNLEQADEFNKHLNDFITKLVPQASYSASEQA